jgi:hypothetical protein
MTQNSVVQPGARRHEEETEELARNKKLKIVGGQKRLVTFIHRPYKMETILEELQD